MDTIERRIVAGAARLRMPVAEYRARVEAGLKWCYRCQAWHPREAFGQRASTPSGLDTECRAARNARARETMRRLYWRRRRGTDARVPTEA